MENTANKILVPIDFSEHSLAGLEQSYNLAKFSKSEIVLLHVIVENKSFWKIFSQQEREDYIEKINKKLDEYIESITKETGLSVSKIVVTGKLIETILSQSEKIKAKMIVVGTTSSTNMMQKLIGSNALRLINEAKCPVVTLKNEHPRKKCENIIVPLDLSKETGRKVKTAISLAKFFGGKIFAVTAVTTNVEYDLEKLRKQLYQVRKFVNEHNVECETEFIKLSSGGKDKISNALLEYSDKVNGDIMLIMTQQENEIVEFFIGSLAKEIIHKAKIPVMSIIPKK